MLVILLVLGVATLTSGFVAEVQTVGHCKDLSKVHNDNHNFQKFAAEEGWEYSYVPDTADNRHISSMWLSITKEKSPAHSYKLHTEYQPLGYHVHPIIDDLVYLNNKNEIVSVAKFGNEPEFKIILLKYVPKEYAFYYKCSNKKDGDSKLDHRYILRSPKGLTKTQTAELLALDKKLKFSGKLWHIE